MQQKYSSVISISLNEILVLAGWMPRLFRSSLAWPDNMAPGWLF